MREAIEVQWRKDVVSCLQLDHSLHALTTSLSARPQLVRLQTPPCQPPPPSAVEHAEIATTTTFNTGSAAF
jgi:hypothetical protein